MDIPRQGSRSSPHYVAPETQNFTAIEDLPLDPHGSNDPNPKPLETGPPSLLSNPLVWLTIILTAAVGVVATVLHFRKHYVMPLQEQKLQQEYKNAQLEKSKTPLTPTSSTDWAKVYQPDPNNVAKMCSKLVNAQNTFAIFKYGTCILLIEPIKDPVKSAKSTLKIISNPSMKYTVSALDNHNYLVTFDKYVVCWLFAEDIAKHKTRILSDPELAPEAGRDSHSGQKMTDFEQRLGKLARVLIQEDAKNLEIAKIVRARQNNKPSNNTSKKPAPPKSEKAKEQKKGSAAPAGNS